MRTLRTALGALFWVCAMCGPVQARTAQVVLYATGSLGGQVWPVGSEASGGLLSWGGLLQQHRLADGEEVLWLHSGPLLSGSLEEPWLREGLYESLLGRLAPAVWQVMPPEADRLKEALATGGLRGVSLLRSERAADLRFIDGARVAFLGLVDDEAQDAVAWLTQQVQDVLVEAPDLIVVVTRETYRPHASSSKARLNRLVARFPEVNVWVGTGSRAEVYPLGSSATVVLVPPGGAALARVELAYDTIRAEVEVTGADFYTCTESVPLMPMPDARTEKALNAVRRQRDQVVARKPPQGWPEDDDLMGMALCRAGGADVSLFAAPAPQADWPPEVLTRADVWARYPGRSSPVVLSLTPGQLRGVLEAGARGPLRVHGVSSDAEGSSFLWPDGRPVHGRARVRVAISQELVFGAQALPRLAELAAAPEQRMENASTDIFSALCDVLSRPLSPGPASGPAQSMSRVIQ